MIVLPFLAPRLFEPWPSPSGKAHLRTRAIRIRGDVDGRDHDSSPQGHGRENPRLRTQIRRRKERGTNVTLLPNVVRKFLTDGPQTPDQAIAEEKVRRAVQFGRSLNRTTLDRGAVLRKVESHKDLVRQQKSWIPRRVGYEVRRRSSFPLGAQQAMIEQIGRRVSRPRRPSIHLTEDDQRMLEGQRAQDRSRTRVHTYLKAHALKIPESRVRLVSLSLDQDSSLNPSFSAWNSQFNIINLRHEKFMTGHSSPRFLPPQRYLTSRQFRIAFIRHESSNSLQISWENLNKVERAQVWPEVMITALNSYPNSALKILVATFTSPFPPRYAVTDTLSFIISHYLRGQQNPDPKHVLQILHSIQYLSAKGPEDYICLSQSSIYLLLSNLPPPHLLKFYTFLGDIGHPLHENTLIQFASQFGKQGLISAAFEALQRLSRVTDFKSTKILRLCTTLLRRKYLLMDGSYSESELFKFMLECGLEPNVHTHNVLLQNSLQAGDPETAWQIHDMMIENGVGVDSHTYSILLNDAKLRLDRPAVDRVIAIVREKGIKNEHIATDHLHAIFLFHEEDRFANSNSDLSSGHRKGGATAIEQMLPVYSEYFRREPFNHLIPHEMGSSLFPELHNSHSSEPSLTPDDGAELMDPPARTLILMLASLVRGFSEPGHAESFYDHFRNLELTGDPAIAELIESTHVYDFVLAAFGRFPQTLPKCLGVIAEMLSPSATPQPTISSSPLQPEDQDSRLLEDTALLSTSRTPAPRAPRRPPKPGVFTWSILLRVFMNHGQPRAAEKVLTMMESRGIVPNQVTWNTLVAGYARMQNTAMTVDAVSRLEDAGFEVDDHVMAALTKIHDYRALIEVMRAKARMETSPSQEKEEILRTVTKVVEKSEELNDPSGETAGDGEESNYGEPSDDVRDMVRREDTPPDMGLPFRIRAPITSGHSLVRRV